MVGDAMEFTKRRNLNRGYMKLEVWNDAIELFALVDSILGKMSSLDLRLRGQILAAAQSVSSNISEGYGRRSINEYLYFLNVSLGSLAELMTRMVGLKTTQRIADASFDRFDECHYKTEHKLRALVKSLQAKRRKGSWESEIRDPGQPYMH
jgi:four helix bundle protein